MIKIGDFSKLSRISIRMLRYYDEEDILKPYFIDESNGYRYYKASQLLTTSLIVNLRDLGFGSHAIRDIVDNDDNKQLLQSLFEVQKKTLKDDKRALEHRLKLLDSLMSKLEGDSDMSLVVNVKTIPERLVMSTRDTLEKYEDEGKLWEVMFQDLKHQKFEMANPSISCAIFHDKTYKEQDVDVEIQVSIVSEIQETDNVKCKMMPSVEVASVIMKGSYNTMTDVAHTMGHWIENNGYEFAGAMFNIYIVSPAQNPDPNEWITEVCYPIKKK
ncbi:MerR family transcriptional regulator [Erysipelothrix urinaevulpis]|uniref:MerR family transcriptional regulator n=1 Tax=Erysipelothrix urinaevulpis TaxID=2683717 RepID=UPI0013592F01|nr:MerR family transcriptional regulator [Erysipelothrix urinaevulpis]